VQDVESQDFSFGKPESPRREKMHKRLPWPLRVVWFFVRGVGKVILFFVTSFFKAVLSVLTAIGRCTGMASKYSK
jgi:hypothetical protein